jgi:N-acetylglucosamine-6-phosphate deacetylase
MVFICTSVIVFRQLMDPRYADGGARRPSHARHSMLMGPSTLVIRGGEALVDGRLQRRDVVMEHGRISELTDRMPPKDAAVFDAVGCVVAPGFVDVQLNGGFGVDLASEPQRVPELAVHLTSTGVTSFLPTIVSSSPGGTARAIAAVTGAPRPADGARRLGIHLEGPYLLTARRGAHHLPSLRGVDLDELTGWSAEGGVALVTLAPELPGALEAIRVLTGQGVAVCAGHTEASADVIREAVAAGLVGMTHLFNAMAPFNHRDPGPVGAALAHPSLVSGLIVDGVHVDPVAVRVAWRALGPDQLMLVSDAIAALGLPPGRHRLGAMEVEVDGRSVRTADGVLAGSVLAMDQAVRNLMEFTGCSLVEALRCATEVPARLLRRDDVGRLAVGCVADAVVLDDRHEVVATVVGGRVVHHAR